jgi:hypothetical protein
VTRADLLEELRKRGYELPATTLRDWTRNGKISAPERDAAGRFRFNGRNLAEIIIKLERRALKRSVRATAAALRTPHQGKEEARCP